MDAGLHGPVDSIEASAAHASRGTWAFDQTVPPHLSSSSSGYASGGRLAIAHSGTTFVLSHDGAATYRVGHEFRGLEMVVHLDWSNESGLSSREHLLFTERGVVILPRNGPVIETGGSFNLMPRRDDPPGEWRAWFPSHPERTFERVHRPALIVGNGPHPLSLIFTTTEAEPSGPEHGRAFRFAYSDPIATLLPFDFDGGLPPGASVADWADAPAHAAEKVFFRTKGGLAQVLVRTDEVRLTYPVAGLTHWRSVVRMPDALSSDRPRSTFAATDGARLGFTQLRPHESGERGAWIPALPIRATVLDGEGQVLAAPVEDAPWSHEARRLQVKLAPSYTDWWERDLSFASLLGSDGTRVRAQTDGVVAADLRPGTRTDWSINFEDPRSGRENDLLTRTFEVAVVPPAPPPARWILATLAAVALVAVWIVLAVRGWRRLALAWLRGTSWILATTPPDLEAEYDGDTWRDARGDEERLAGDLRSLVGGTDREVAVVQAHDRRAVEVEAQGSLLVDRHSKPVVIGWRPERYAVQRRPAWGTRLVVASVSGSGDDDAAIRAVVRGCGFVGRSRSAEQLREALAEAHIVVVLPGASHALPRVLDDLPGRSLAARLIVADAEAPVPSSDWRAASGLGVSALVMPTRSGRLPAPDLVVELLKRFLPSRSKRGLSLAEAIGATWSEVQPESASTKEVKLFGAASLYVAEAKLFDAFLSHSRKDQVAVLRLKRSLERRRFPWLRRGPRVCRDEESFGIGGSLPKTVLLHLAAARTLVVACSPESAGSDWVEREILAFLQDQGADGVLLCDLPGEWSEGQASDFKRFLERIEGWTGVRDSLRARADRKEDLRRLRSSVSKR